MDQQLLKIQKTYSKYKKWEIQYTKYFDLKNAMLKEIIPQIMESLQKINDSHYKLSQQAFELLGIVIECWFVYKATPKIQINEQEVTQFYFRFIQTDLLSCKDSNNLRNTLFEINIETKEIFGNYNTIKETLTAISNNTL